MRALVTVGILAAASMAPLVGAATTIYVDPSDGNDAWSGLCDVYSGGICGPKATIQAGIDATVNDGDQVILLDGVYRGEGNRGISYFGKAITVRSAGGPDNCIIDVEQQEDPAFVFGMGEPRGAVLDGVMVKNCYGC
jgi:hypothetical protein